MKQEKFGDVTVISGDEDYKNGQWVSVPATVNFPCFGVQSPDDVRKFMADLQAAVEHADKLNGKVA